MKPRDVRLDGLRGLPKLLATVLRDADVSRADLPSLIGYLDYVDHCRYSEAEVEAAMTALCDAGVAAGAGDGWRFVAG